jgi:hypothetical protein
MVGVEYFEIMPSVKAMQIFGTFKPILLAVLMLVPQKLVYRKNGINGFIL